MNRLRQRQQRIQRPDLAGFGDLPEDLQRERRGKQGFDPSTGLAVDWVNRYKTTNFGTLIGLASRNILQNNGLRTYLLVQNKDAVSDLFLTFTTDASAFAGILIIPRGNYELIGGEAGGSFVPSDSVNLIGAAAGMNVVIVEGTLMPYELATRRP